MKRPISKVYTTFCIIYKIYSLTVDFNLIVTINSYKYMSGLGSFLVRYCNEN